MELTDAEIRVLGCLVEKQRTTPDQYPLSLNALRLACNQSTNRDPVVDYDESTVREAAQRLSSKRIAKLASGAGSRAVKYRHVAGEALGVSDAELAVLCVLMLRGAQTPGELKGRTERLWGFGSVGEVVEVLERLIDRGRVERLDRRPGQKEERYVQLLGGGGDSGVAGPEPASSGPAPPGELSGAGGVGSDLGAADRPGEGAGGGTSVDAERLDRLETEVRDLRAALEALRAELGA